MMTWKTLRVIQSASSAGDKVKKFTVILMILAMSVLGGACGWDQVDPGNVGILIDKGDGTVTPIYETKWMFLGWYQTLVEWPLGNQVYIMDKGGPTGQIAGDDSIRCLTLDTQNIDVDTQTDWQIDPKDVVTTYVSWRNVPLTGPFNRPAPGNFLEDLIIRNETRSAVREVCATYTWADILGEKQLEFQSKVADEVKGSTKDKGVIVTQVTIRQRYPSPQLQALMDARLEGQKQRETSSFAAAQAKRQQEIDQNAAIAAAEKARIEAESKAQLDITKATSDAEVARVRAVQEAEAIRSRGTAEAASLKAQAEAVTPALVDLERARKWNGQGPTTILGSDPQIINQMQR